MFFKKINRALEDDFAKIVITHSFLLWRLPEFSEFLHLTASLG